MNSSPACERVCYAFVGLVDSFKLAHWSGAVGHKLGVECGERVDNAVAVGENLRLHSGARTPWDAREFLKRNRRSRDRRHSCGHRFSPPG